MKRSSWFNAIGFALALFIGSANLAHAVLITEWNFNGGSATTVPGGTSSPTPSTGSGTASLQGGTTATFASGIASGGSSDPITTVPPNYGWNTTNYAAQSNGDKTRGAAFFVDTTGYQDIQIEYDLRHSNTSSRYEQVQYTTNGGMTWSDAPGGFFDGNAGDTWFNNRFVDLTSITAVNNITSFGFRVVATFDPASGQYAASSPTGTYAPTGTWRFDMVQISGTLIPEPAAAAMILLGCGLLIARRRLG